MPTSEYQLELEKAASLQSLQVTLNSFNIIMCLLRLFKYYEFQDRLNILTRTFSRSWVDL